MKKIFLSIIILNVLLSQCDNVSSYVCQLNPECEWFSESTEGMCSELNQDQCQSGQYNYCYWNGWGGSGECMGGNYILKNEYCGNANNIITKYVDKKIDDGLVRLLLDAGFQKIEINNEKIFRLREGKETFSLSYSDIKIRSNGVELIKPKLQLEERNNTISILTFESISINLSFNQIIYMLEELIYDEELTKLSSFDLNFKNGYASQNNFHRSDPWSIAEISIKDITVMFDGYINNRMIEDLDRGKKIPSTNQSFEFSIKEFSIDKLIDKENMDLLNEPLRILGLDGYRRDLFRINSFNCNAYYLPQNDRIEASFDFRHPLIGAKGTANSKVVLDYYDIEKCYWDSAHMDGSLTLNLLGNKTLNLEQLPFIKKQPVVLTRLPDNITVGFTLDYRKHLQQFIESILRENPIIDNNVSLNINASMNNISFDIADILPNTYNSYTEKAYASDAKTQIKTLLEECKIWKTSHEDFPTDVQEMIDEGFGNISKSTLRKWTFEIDLESWEGWGLEGSINATSSEDMPGGAGKKVCFDVSTGRYTGYGTDYECDSYARKEKTIFSDSSYTDFDISKISADVSLMNNKVTLKSNLSTNLFTTNLIGDIDIFDATNPWINKLNLNIYNIDNILEKYIEIAEREGQIKIERSGYGNDINISIYGNPENPQIEGIGPADR